MKLIRTQYRVSTEYGHPYKFVYFVIHKNGTRSIFNLFNFKQESFKFYDPNMYKDYFTWTMVRNPWDRLVSAYINKASKKYGPWSKFENLTFSDFIYNKEGIENSHTCIQNTQIPPDIDFIGKYENFQEDFDIICDKIGIPRHELPHKNASKHKHYTEYYDDETRQIVAEKYAKDIEYFGYKFGE
ncbi:MAG: sulfotransferase family 2 domain-containing protein [Thermodesulfobacteriota bacterium]|nr:sulfotransferase family 2 domain-containing protein [Thermodesulfobacteriota bacterium]